jgi:hypothetical protein
MAWLRQLSFCKPEGVELCLFGGGGHEIPSYGVGDCRLSSRGLLGTVRRRTFPATSERMRDVWTFVCITCPIAIAGMHRAISLSETLAANALTYALVGLIVETFRKRLHHAH